MPSLQTAFSVQSPQSPAAVQNRFTPQPVPAEARSLVSTQTAARLE